MPQHQLEDLRPGKPDWRRAFLKTLEMTGCVKAACLDAGVSRDTAYRHRERFPKFRKKWFEALEVAVEALEYQARGRAFAGPEDPGSTTLLIFLLKAHKPEMYRDQPKKDDGVSQEALLAAAGLLMRHIPEGSEAHVLAGIKRELADTDKE